MARVDTDQATILLAVVALLIAAVETTPTLSPETCFLSLTPEPPSVLSSDVFVTVATTDGVFDDGLLDGGGLNQTTENAGFVVTVFQRQFLDQSSHAVTILTDAARGMLGVKLSILKALSAHDLSLGSDQLLRNLIAPTKATAPYLWNKDENIVAMPLYFATEFDWKLT